MRPAPFRLASLLAFVVIATPVARAENCLKVMRSQSPLQQVAQADVVIIGTVADIEPELVVIDSSPGTGKTAHAVANVRIRETLLGANGLTNVRIGFLPNPDVDPDDDFGCQKGGFRPWYGPTGLREGFQACFFLQKHPSADFYMMVPIGYPLKTSGLQFENEIEGVKIILRAFAKPIEALQAKEASDRQLAAGALVMRYCVPLTRTPSNRVGEAIPIEESKLILMALAEMKWEENPFDHEGRFGLQKAISRLQLTEKDGWKEPVQKVGDDLNALMDTAARKWLRDNAGKYRIQRLFPVEGKSALR